VGHSEAVPLNFDVPTKQKSFPTKNVYPPQTLKAGYGTAWAFPENIARGENVRVNYFDGIIEGFKKVNLTEF